MKAWSHVPKVRVIRYVLKDTYVLAEEVEK